jgi:hypothetical protein
MTPEEAQALGRFLAALRCLANERRQWMANYRKFDRWDSNRKTRYMLYIEQQATNGLPMAMELMTEVIKLRMLE